MAISGEGLDSGTLAAVGAGLTALGGILVKAVDYMVARRTAGSTDAHAAYTAVQAASTELVRNLFDTIKDLRAEVAELRQALEESEGKREEAEKQVLKLSAEVRGLWSEVNKRKAPKPPVSPPAN